MDIFVLYLFLLSVIQLIIKGLIDGFADLEVEGSITSTKSPLHYAAEIGSMVLIDALLLPFKF